MHLYYRVSSTVQWPLVGGTAGVSRSLSPKDTSRRHSVNMPTIRTPAADINTMLLRLQSIYCHRDKDQVSMHQRKASNAAHCLDVNVAESDAKEDIS